jgi:hypothetical protein
MPTSLAALWALITASPWISSLIGLVLATYVMPWLSQKFPQLQSLWAIIGTWLAKIFPPAPNPLNRPPSLLAPSAGQSLTTGEFDNALAVIAVHAVRSRDAELINDISSILERAQVAKGASV